MKKFFKLTMVVFISISTLYGAKMGGPDENGRLYKTAYFDTVIDGQSPILDVISYSKRIGTFDWSKVDSKIKGLKTDMQFTISTRLEVPKNITTDSIYVTIGELYGFRVDGSNFEATTKKRFYNDPIFILSTYVNENHLKGAKEMLAKTKADAFGNKYVDLKIVFTALRGEDSFSSTYKNYKKNIAKQLNNIKIKVAPKSRTFQNKWVEPKIYVMDE